MSTFTPTDVVDMAKEKDWAANIGMLDWDSTRIVFSKRTLIEFLRYTGVTVDTNFSNIQKLPKYATFGKLGDAQPESLPPSTSAESTASPEPAVATGEFRPTRRVRTAPGGETHDLFGHYVDDDALANAPPKTTEPETESARRGSGSFWDPPTNNDRPQFKPTRRVREYPGGRDSIADIL